MEPRAENDNRAQSVGGEQTNELEGTLTRPIEVSVSSVLAVNVPPSYAGEIKKVTLADNQEVRIQSINDAFIVGERYPIVFIDPQGFTTAIADSHLIRPNLSFDAQRSIDSSWSAPNSEIVKLKTPVLFLAGPGADNFYHWMHDCLPRLLVAERAGLDVSVLVPKASDKNPFIGESLELLGMDDKIIEFPGGKVEAPEVWVVEDLFYLDPVQIHQSLLNAVRERFLSAVNLDSDPGHGNKIFISREGKDTTRTLANHSEVEEVLVGRHGFKKIQMDKLPLEEQIRTSVNAREIVGPHGAGLFNTLFMAEGNVTEFFPLHPDRHNDPDKQLVAPCWFRILGAHQDNGRSVQWNQRNCEVEMLSSEDSSQYRLIVERSDLSSWMNT